MKIGTNFSIKLGRYAHLYNRLATNVVHPIIKKKQMHYKFGWFHNTSIAEGYIIGFAKLPSGYD